MTGFDFTIGRDRPCATWLSSGISFNEKCLSLLGYPPRVCVGIDREGRRLAIKAADGEREGHRERGEAVYNFATGEKGRKRVLLCSASLRRELKTLLGARPPRGGVRFPVFFEEAEKLLIVDLKGRY